MHPKIPVMAVLVALAAACHAPVAHRLVFVGQPASATAGATLAPAITVVIEDASGQRMAQSTASVTISLVAKASGATLSGTLTQPAVGGIATFSDLSVQTAGEGYALLASSGSLDPALSSAFAITPSQASQIVLDAPLPASVMAGTPLPPVSATVRDQFGNIASAPQANLTVSLGTNPTGASLQGTLSQAVTDGAATFSDLSIKKAGAGYTLTVASGSLTLTSAAFSVTAAAASQLILGGAPAMATAGATLATPVTVSVEDTYGNLVNDPLATVTLILATHPEGGKLLGTVTQSFPEGVATFADLSLLTAGSGYSLQAVCGSLMSTPSSAFNVTPASATQLVFMPPPPATLTAGSTFLAAVSVEDAYGNVVADSTAPVTVSLSSNPSQDTLKGTLTQAASMGRATFGDLSLVRASSGYSLTASSGSLASVTSSAFSVTSGAASQLAFINQPPVSVVAGTAIPLSIAVEDAYGNTVTSSTAPVNLALGQNPGSDTLHAAMSQAAVNGIAAFANPNVQIAGVGYTVTASSSGLTSATSTAFSVTAAAPARLAFGVQPPALVSASVTIAPAVTVLVEDAFGNVTRWSTPITLSLLPATSTATLAGTLAQPPLDGVATFGDLNVSLPGSGYALAASSGALAGATSSTFSVAGWRNLSPAQQPPARELATLTYDSARSEAVLFGGAGTSGALGDTWLWDGANWSQPAPAHSPPARVFASATYDTLHSTTVLFGGAGSPGPLADTWTWDGTDWTQQMPANSPPASAGVGLAFDAARGVTVLFGGNQGGTYTNDTWTWDGTNWTKQSPAMSPSARWAPVMAYDTGRQVTVLFGGLDVNAKPLNDVWEWDGMNWTPKVPATTPALTQFNCGAYDPMRHLLVVFGANPVANGGSTTFTDQTWAWDGTNWTQAGYPPPAARIGASMTYDASGVGVLFGGISTPADSMLGDTWELLSR